MLNLESVIFTLCVLLPALLGYLLVALVIVTVIQKRKGQA